MAFDVNAARLSDFASNSSVVFSTRMKRIVQIFTDRITGSGQRLSLRGTKITEQSELDDSQSRNSLSFEEKIRVNPSNLYNPCASKFSIVNCTKYPIFAKKNQLFSPFVPKSLKSTLLVYRDKNKIKEENQMKRKNAQSEQIKLNGEKT